MKKNANLKALSNVFKEIENSDQDEAQLNTELKEIGISPEGLVKRLHERIKSIKDKDSRLDIGQKSAAEFDAYLLAAGKPLKKKLENISKKIKKK